MWNRTEEKKNININDLSRLRYYISLTFKRQPKRERKSQKRLWQILKEIEKDLKRKYQHFAAQISFFLCSLSVMLMGYLVTTTLQMPQNIKKHKKFLSWVVEFFFTFYIWTFLSRFVYLPLETSLICVDFIMIFYLFFFCFPRNRHSNSHLPNVLFEFTFLSRSDVVT